MFPILNIVSNLPWRLIGVSVLASVLFVGGCQYGERRVTARWDAEKAATAQAIARQAEHVAAVTAHQTTINQEISNEFRADEKQIAADRHHLLARVPRRVRHHAASRSGAVPEVPTVAARTDAASADAVPVTEQPASNTTCEKLAEDAAQTTLMVAQFQKWYREQVELFAAHRLKTPRPDSARYQENDHRALPSQ